jgi:hypothetical protein
VSEIEIVIETEIETVTVIVTEKETGNVIKTGTVIGVEIETEIGTVIGTGTVTGIGTEKGVGGVIVIGIVTRVGIETGIVTVIGIVIVTEIGRETETEIETGESLSITMRTDSKFLVHGQTRYYLNSSKERSQRNQASWTGCVAWPMTDTLELIGMTAGMYKHCTFMEELLYYS